MSIEIVAQEYRKNTEPLFGDMDDTTITSCIQGYCGGVIWADSAESPTIVRAQLGGRLKGSGGFAFVAGDAESELAEELLRKWDEQWQGSLIIVPQNERWCRRIEQCFGDKASAHTRYATSKSEHHFDRAQLEHWAQSLPEPYTLHLMNAEYYNMCKESGWALDCVANYATAQEYEQYGMGVICMCGDEPAGVVSTYSSYDKGIEIEIDTNEAHRRKGIARANASRLLLECFDRGLYPSWDAANTMSLGLAKQLGYVFEREYPAYYIANPRELM